GVGFAFILYCAAAVLMVQRRWWRLLHAAALTFGIEVAILSRPDPSLGIDWGTVLAVVAFVAVTAAAAVLHTLRLRRPRVPVEAAIQLVAACTAATVAAFLLFPTDQQTGIALVAAGVAFLMPGIGLLQRDRDLASLLGAGGMLVAGIGLGEGLE